MAKATRTTILTDQKHLGKEPTFTNSELSKVELINALNWYNYFSDSDRAKQYITEYCQLNKIKINISKHTTNTFAWLARMITRGAVLDAETQSKFTDYINSLKRRGSSQVEPIAANNNTPVQNRLNLWMPDIEDMVDDYKSSHSLYSYIQVNNIPQMYVRQIQEYYQPILDEVSAAYNKSDSELQEAYKPYTRTELKALMTRLKNMVEDCDKHLNNVKRERAPRKKRTKSVDTILKHFKYLKHDNTLQITSEDPSKIIGANAVYVLNTKYNTLTAFFAKDSESLTISRTAITNFDEKQSQTKRVGRRLKDVIKSLQEGSKRSRVKILTEIKTDPIRFTDRLNENCLIMKVDK